MATAPPGVPQELPDQFLLNLVWGTAKSKAPVKRHAPDNVRNFYCVTVRYRRSDTLRAVLERFFQPQPSRQKLQTLAIWIYNLAQPKEPATQSPLWWPHGIAYTYLKYTEGSGDIKDEDVITLAACVLKQFLSRAIEELDNVESHCADSLERLAKSAMEIQIDETASSCVNEDEEDRYHAGLQDHAIQRDPVVPNTASPTILMENPESFSSKSTPDTSVFSPPIDQDNTSQSITSCSPRSAQVEAEESFDAPALEDQDLQCEYNGHKIIVPAKFQADSGKLFNYQKIVIDAKAVYDVEVTTRVYIFNWFEAQRKVCAYVSLHPCAREKLPNSLGLPISLVEKCNFIVAAVFYMDVATFFLLPPHSSETDLSQLEELYPPILAAYGCTGSSFYLPASTDSSRSSQHQHFKKRKWGPDLSLHLGGEAKTVSHCKDDFCHQVVGTQPLESEPTTGLSQKEVSAGVGRLSTRQDWHSGKYNLTSTPSRVPFTTPFALPSSQYSTFKVEHQVADTREVAPIQYMPEWGENAVEAVEKEVETETSTPLSTLAEPATTAAPSLDQSIPGSLFCSSSNHYNQAGMHANLSLQRGVGAMLSPTRSMHASSTASNQPSFRLPIAPDGSADIPSQLPDSHAYVAHSPVDQRLQKIVYSIGHGDTLPYVGFDWATGPPQSNLPKTAPIERTPATGISSLGQQNDPYISLDSQPTRTISAMSNNDLTTSITDMIQFGSKGAIRIVITNLIKSKEPRILHKYGGYHGLTCTKVTEARLSTPRWWAEEVKFLAVRHLERRND